MTNRLRAAVLAVACIAGATAPVRAGQSTSPVLVDHNMSVGAGAATMATFGEAVARAENAFVPHRLLAERGGARRTANVMFRVGRFVFFDAPQERLMMVLNHELFGHGARVRERFEGPIGYRFHAPPPYGPGGAATSFIVDREPSAHERLAIHAAGMEANGVAAGLLASRAIGRGVLPPRDAMRYLQFELDTLSYVFSNADDEPGHDVGDFVDFYNELAADADASPLRHRTLRREALVSLANPMLAYAGWSIGRYLTTGAVDSAVPTLTVAGVRYLPLMRYRLTPFGTEWALVNELGGRVRPMQIELRVGRALDARPWGIGVRQRELSVWRGWALDLDFAVWRQPRFTESADDPFPPPPRVGAQLRGRLERPLVPVWFSTPRATLILELGVKSAGFVPGEPLGAGVHARAGVGLPLAR